MKRREFLKFLGLGVGAAFAFKALPRPCPASASGLPSLRLGLLADAHLKDGNPARPEARALARAVAEIRAFKPAPDLVLFAGDLAHDGDPKALALGKDILADLPAPLLLVRGEGDERADGGKAWSRLFGEPRFACDLRGVNVLGLHLTLKPTAFGPAFVLTEAELRWLAGKLARLDPAVPLVILSHAPLGPIFRPWHQWTAGTEGLTYLLAPFRRVLLLHGHVHQTKVGLRSKGQVLGNSEEWSIATNPRAEAGRRAEFSKTRFFHSENRKPKTENSYKVKGQWAEPLVFPGKDHRPQARNLPLPATAWPLPFPLQGTPRRLQPGLPPHGCGWSLLTIQGRALTYVPFLWAAA